MKSLGEKLEGAVTLLEFSRTDGARRIDHVCDVIGLPCLTFDDSAVHAAEEVFVNLLCCLMGWRDSLKLCSSIRRKSQTKLLENESIYLYP